MPSQIRHPSALVLNQNCTVVGAASEVVALSNPTTSDYVQMPVSGGSNPFLEVSFPNTWVAPRDVSTIDAYVSLGCGTGAYGADVTVNIGDTLGGVFATTGFHLSPSGLFVMYQPISATVASIGTLTNLFVSVVANNRAAWTANVWIAEIYLLMEEPKFRHLVLASGHLQEVDGDTLGYLKQDAGGHLQQLPTAVPNSDEALQLLSGHVGLSPFTDPSRT